MTKSTVRVSSAISAAPDDARGMSFIAFASGDVLAASPALCAAVAADETALVGRNVLSLLRPANKAQKSPRKDVWRRMSAPDGATEPVLPQGFLPVFLAGQNEAVLFNIDHITSGDGHAYILGYAIDGSAADVALAPTQVMNLLPSPRTKTIHLDGQWSWMPQEEERMTQEELAIFVEMTANTCLILDLDGGVVHANSRGGTSFWRGWAKGDTRNLLDTVVEDDRPAFRSLLTEVSRAENGMVAQMESRHVRGDGRNVVYSWRFSPLSETQVAALGVDVTNAKQQERNLRRREQQLSEAEAIARMGQWRWVVGTNIFDWSSEIYRIFGVDSSRFTPSIDNVHPMINRRDLATIYQAFQRAIIQQNDYEIDFRVNHPSGQTRHVRCEGRCEMDENGGVVALYGVMQDITVQVEHERDLRKAKESAENAYASKSRFLANMSHELRTPLNAIIGFSDLMQKQMLGPLGHERYVDYVGAIKESGQHLLDLISDILDMSKIEAGKYELHVEPVEIQKLLSLTAQMMEGRAQDAGVTLISRKEAAEGVVIRADRRAVMQMLLNLVSNAVKFTPAGGEVELSCKKLDTQIALSVRDTGIGIPANRLADVVRPFEQVSNAFSRKHEGSGLGLAITKDLVELHGGTMNIDSKMGLGTTVTIRLPIEPKTIN